MADLVSTDDLIDSECNRTQGPFTYEKSVTMVAGTGQIWSQWLGVGRPEAGVAPGAAAVPTSTTAGALARFTNPTSGETLRMLKYYAIAGNSTSALTLYDRLVHSGGLSGVVTTAQAVNTPALTRGDTTGIGVVGFVECYVALGATPRTLSVSYTNTAGVAGRTGSASIPANMLASRMVAITLQAGDLGIRSIETVTLSGTTGTAGNFGVTMARRIEGFNVGMQGQNNVPMHRTGLNLALPKIEADACLWHLIRSLTAGSGIHRGGFSLLSSG